MLVGGEEDHISISTARRAAELIQFYWKDLYDEHIADLAVTPATMLATVGLFLGMANHELIDLQDYWEMPTGGADPVGFFLTRLERPAPTQALAQIFESRSNVWEPMPMSYGLDLQWLAEVEPNDQFALLALIWRLWSKNPVMMNYFGHLADDAYERLVDSADLQERIKAVQPLPYLDIPHARDAFWLALDIELGTSDLHPVTLAEVVSYAIGQTDNQWAALSCNDLNEGYFGNYGIAWNDPDHVRQVKAQQEEAEALVQGFWQVADAITEHPPLIGGLAEALHEVTALVQALHPNPYRAAAKGDSADAERRYFARFAAALGGGEDLAAVQAFFGGELLAVESLPTTVEDWLLLTVTTHLEIAARTAVGAPGSCDQYLADLEANDGHARAEAQTEGANHEAAATRAA